MLNACDTLFFLTESVFTCPNVLKKCIQLFLILIIPCQYLFVHAQLGNKRKESALQDLISNGDFERCDSICVATHAVLQPCPDPFNSSCIDSWYASHGSPEFSITDHAAIIGSVKSNGYQWGEGIYQTLDQPVDSGMAYLMILNFQGEENSSNGNSTLIVQLTNQQFQPGSCFEMVPIPGSDIFRSPFQAIPDQKNLLIYFVAPGRYNKIWFYHLTESDPVVWLKIRSVHLYRIENNSPLLIQEALMNAEHNRNRKNVQETVLSESPIITGQTNLLITNPSPECIYDFTGCKIRVIEITNTNGEPIENEKENRIDPASLQPGKYLLTIFFAEPLPHTRKYLLVKE